MLLLGLLLPVAQAFATVPDVEPQISKPSFQDIETELGLFESVNISAKAAVETVERALPGATVVDIGFDVHESGPVYHTKIEIGGDVSDATIDARSKIVVRRPASAATTANDRKIVADFKRLGIPLSEIASIGETYGQGRAVSASLDYNNGNLTFLVVVLSRGHLRQVSIDPTDQAKRPRHGALDDLKRRAGIIDEMVRLYRSPYDPSRRSSACLLATISSVMSKHELSTRSH